MSWGRKVREVLIGLLMLAMACVMATFPDVGYVLVQIALSLALLVAGAGRVAYYHTMARHMVGGKTVLYTGVVLFDLGLLSLSISAIPQVYVMLYLVAIHLFGGVVSILQARQQRGYGADSWRLAMAGGVVDVALAVLCLVFMGSLNVATYVYAAGLAWSGVMRIVSALRRTAIVYIA